MKRRNFITAAILAASAAPAKVSAYAPIDQYAVECKRLKESVHRIFGENVRLTIAREMRQSCGYEHCEITVFVMLNDADDTKICLLDKNVHHADASNSVSRLRDFIEARADSMVVGGMTRSFDNGRQLS